MRSVGGGACCRQPPTPVASQQRQEGCGVNRGEARFALTFGLQCFPAQRGKKIEKTTGC